MLYSTDVIGTSRGKDEGEVFNMITKEFYWKEGSGMKDKDTECTGTFIQGRF